MATNLIHKLDLDADYLYPDSDGKPMSDNTEQYEWIVKIKENLEILFAENPNVFIAGDLLWYPVKSTLVNPCAPDVMIAIGRPKGKRGSYKQWVEDNIAPQVVFEILSPSNTKSEMNRKLEFYETYGVEEYYVYDPKPKIFQGWLRQKNRLKEIKVINGWISNHLGIRFQLESNGLEIYYPNGEKFLTSIELAQKWELEKQRANLEKQRADVEKQRADVEKQRAEEAQQQANVEKQRAEEAQQQANLEKQRAEEAQQQANLEKQRAKKLAQKLRELGINPDNL